MSFVGGGNDIAIATALTSTFVYCTVNIKQFMDFHNLIFYGCLRIRPETNPGPRRPVPAVCRILCSNVLGQAGNPSDLTVA